MYNDEILKLPLEYIDISNSKIIDPLSIFRMRTLKKITIAENQYPNIKLPKRKLIFKK